MTRIAFVYALTLGVFSSLAGETQTSTQPGDDDGAFFVGTNDIFPEKSLPFSFTYGGKSSRDLLKTWVRAKDERRWTDPATGLEVTCELKTHSKHSAVDWVLYFRNGGQQDTPIIENIRPLDLDISLPAGNADVQLHRAHGSTCAATDFLPIQETVKPDADIHFIPSAGRSSDDALPFFNVQWPGGGAVVGIGWSGQWMADVRRDKGRMLNLQAGQQFARFKLHPGERVRTPRILLLRWNGNDWITGQNQLRRLLLDAYVPRLDGKVVVPPVTHNTWFTFGEGNGVNEKNQLECIQAMARTGVEYYWLDAGWFEGGWPSGVGSWVPKSEAFPRGLKPLGDAAHAAGMKFIVWFEPERVDSKSRIAREHPEWVLQPTRNEGWGGLFNLGLPEARQWLTNHLSRCIGDWGIDVYRNDFNIDPLRFWKKADEPDRQGITEIRYIEGLYAMWDELWQRHPHIFIDNCASGGRRIDLETMSRSIPLWRSDSSAMTTHPMPVQDQVQTAGLSLWVPLHTAGVWSFDPYAMYSVATTGMNLSKDARAADYPVEQATRAIAEVKRLRPLWLGDFYPIGEINLDAHHWIGWQLHRADLSRGCVMLFRRDASPYTMMNVSLQAIEPAAEYTVTLAAGDQRVMSGRDLQTIKVEIATSPSFALIEYAKRP